jgi:hypothetical protein
MAYLTVQKVEDISKDASQRSAGHCCHCVARWREKYAEAGFRSKADFAL